MVLMMKRLMMAFVMSLCSEGAIAQTTAQMAAPHAGSTGAAETAGR